MLWLKEPKGDILQDVKKNQGLCENCPFSPSIGSGNGLVLKRWQAITQISLDHFRSGVGN